MQSVTLVRWLMLGMLFGGALGCGGGGSEVSDGGVLGDASNSAILATLAPVPARATQVIISSTLNNQPATNMQTLKPPTDSFAVELPSTQSGRLVLNAVAYDSDNCVQGSSTGMVDLPAFRATLPMPLMAQSPRKCGSLAPCAANTVCAATKPASPAIYSIWTFAPTNIWAVGITATILHFDGTSWTTVSPPAGVTDNLFGVWGNAANNIWAVGAAGRIIHYDGAAWTTVPSTTTQTLYGIWGVSNTDIWAVGTSSSPTNNQGVFLHYNGVSWAQIVDINLGTNSFNSVWADNPNFIYACGVGGLLVRWNGTAWSTIISNTMVNLHSIWGTKGGITSSVVFATGDTGVIMRVRYDMPSPSWAQIPSSGTASTLFGIIGDNSQTVYAVGSGGAVIRSDTFPYDKFVVQPSSSQATLFGVSLGTNGLMWTVGGAGFIGYLDARP